MNELNLILKVGLPIVLGIFAVSLLLSVISLWISGKIVRSINDEFTSALKAVGYCLIINVILGLINAGFTWVSGQMEALTLALNILMILLWLIGIFTAFMITKNVYDIGYLKTFGLIILSFIIYVVLAGGVGFATFIFGGSWIQSRIPADFMEGFNEGYNEEMMQEAPATQTDPETPATPPSMPNLDSNRKGPKIPTLPAA